MLLAGCGAGDAAPVDAGGDAAAGVDGITDSQGGGGDAGASGDAGDSEGDAAADAGSVSDAALDTSDVAAPVDVVTAVDAAADTFACPPQPPEAPGPFGRVGDAIVDSLGRTVVLHSANVSNTAKYSPDFMPWHGPDDFADLSAAGFDSVRLLVSWAGVAPEQGTVDDAWLDALALRVDQASDAGLLVVLDMHQDVFGYGFGGNGAPRWACTEERYAAHVPMSPWYRNYLSTPVQECFDRLYYDDFAFSGLYDAWIAVATRFADHPGVLGFDLLNEPHWGTHPAETFVSDIWQRRQEELAAAIRAVAPGRIVLFQGTTLVSLGGVQPFAPACGQGTAYAPHYYHPLVHDGYPYSAGTKPQVELGLDAIGASAMALGDVPVWLGEIGAFPTAPTTPAYLHDLMSLLAERRWGWAWWADDKAEGGFALRHTDGSFQEAIIGIVGHPYAQRVPGTLLQQSMDFGAERYEARFTWSVDAPLQVWAGAADGGAPWAVTLVADGGGEGDCAQKMGAAPGVLDCAAPGETGGAWTVRIER